MNNQRPAIEVKNLCKKYQYGVRLPYYSLRDTVMNIIKNPSVLSMQLTTNASKLSKNEFWALKDVSFTIDRGEVVGIIGRNGAGKSTLLKIISRITYPTSGEVRLLGRVASLLEVGTGFHPELTGKENIFLNGAILGMRRSEIKQKMSKIIEFAEIDKFIDTPVKHYSSGMYMRLAFAVAAHLVSEILIVDEVLSVGDTQFQKKCLGKIHDVADSGRTVLLVSHNTQATLRLCTKVILLENGKIKKKGYPSDVISSYIKTDRELRAHKEWQINSAPGDKIVRLRYVRIYNQEGHIQEVFDSRNDIGIEVGYMVYETVQHLAAEISMYNQEGTLIFSSANQYDKKWFSQHNPGTFKATCWIPGNLLTEGTFYIRVNILQIQIPLNKHVIVQEALIFQVIDTMEGDSARGHVAHQYPGIIRPKLTWKTIQLE